jgi:hypothetical protein
MSGPPDGEPTATPDPASGQASDPCPGGPANASGCSAVPDLAATLTPAPVPPRRSQRGWGGLQRLATAGGGRRARPRRPGRAGPWAAGTWSGWSPWSRPGRRLPLAACCCTWTCGPQPAHPDQGDGGGLPLGRHRGGLGRPAAAAKRPRPGRPQPELLFGRHPVARGVAPTAVLAALAGYLVRESRQPPRLGYPACAPSSRTTVGRRQGIPSSSRSANPDPAGGGRTREPARCC